MMSTIAGWGYIVPALQKNVKNRFRYATGVLFLVVFIAGIHPAFAQQELTWRACLERARKNNPELISAQEDVVQADAATASAQSGLLPRLTASLGASTSQATDSKSRKSYDYGVNGSQLVFDGLKTSAELRQAQQTGSATRHAFRYASAQVRYLLRSAFIGLLKAQENVRVAQEIFEVRRGNLVLITLRYESGLEHKGALLTAEANVAQAKLEVEKARRDTEVAQRQLVRQMGEAYAEPVRAEGSWDVAVPREPPDFVKIAQDNPSLLEAVARKNAAQYGLKAARADFFPTITGQGSVGRSAAHWPPRTNEWSTGVELSWPLFEGGNKTAQLSRARSLLRQALSQERATRDDVILALAENWVQFQDQAETVDVQKKFLAASEERARIAEAQYSLGLIKYDNWTIIQDDLVRAKKSVLDAQANALLAEAAWILAKGETVEYAD